MRFVTILLLVPRNIAIVLLRAYRAAISPLYGEVCRYYPSCSHYTHCMRYRNTAYFAVAA
jgi:hypothetical protein